MSVTALVGLLVVGSAVKTEPVPITIETKIFRTTESALALEGSNNGFKALTKEGDKVHVLEVSRIDDTKLAKNKGLKTISSPVVRTLSEMSAEIQVEGPGKGDASETWKTSYVPKLQPDGSIQVRMSLSVENKSDKDRNWSFTHDPKLTSGKAYGVLVVRPGENLLYVVKAWTDKK